MYEEIFEKLKKSEFRSRFKLKEKDREYLLSKGFETIESHARDFIAKRVAPANPHNDGKHRAGNGLRGRSADGRAFCHGRRAFGICGDNGSVAFFGDFG